MRLRPLLAPASMMESSICAPVIVQSAPMEADGPITELLILALAWINTGGKDLQIRFFFDFLFCCAAVFQQIPVRLQGGIDRTGIQPHRDGLRSHFRDQVLDHDIDAYP